MKRVGRTPLWPDYLPREFPDRKIGILEGRTVYFENNTHVTVANLAALIDVLFSENCLLFVESLSSIECFPFLRASVENDFCEVSCTKNGWPIAARFKGYRNAQRWLVQCSTWGGHADGHFLHGLRDTYRIAKVGTRPTPGSLGQSLLRATWVTGGYGYHTAPNIPCNEFIYAHRHGGRCDVLVHTFQETGEIYPSLVELDMSDAYLAHFMSLPTGTSHKFIHGIGIEKYVTYFAQVEVTIHMPLVYGPFPMRRERGQTIDYPTQPGIYITYLWKEQVEDCLQAGCTVKVNNGYGWEHLTNDTQAWCQLARYLRIQAPTDVSEMHMKQAIVACIGRFGMHQTYYHLVDGEHAEEYEPCVIAKNGDSLVFPDFFVREKKDFTRPAMSHWFSYCIMQCTRTLYHYALPYALAGRLVMTNYDALLIVEQDESNIYPEKHTLASLMCKAGDLRWQRLTNVRILGARSLECDQKRVRPGVSEEGEQIA